MSRPRSAFAYVSFLSSLTLTMAAGIATPQLLLAQTPSTAATESETKTDEHDQKKQPDASERLSAVEQALRQLAAEIQSLKKPPSAAPSPSQPEAPAAGQPAASKVAREQTPPAMKLDPQWVKNVTWRSLGPANMGGRITDIVVHDSDPSLWWVATASGGLLKSTNHGVTVAHQFDREATVSIGAIAADRRDKNLVWVGTGEANPRNSVSYGDGVYKSTDGGKSWKNMGLKESFQIGRILIDPRDSNTVYVGALGRLYGPNSQRGVFKTTDGGESWEKVLYVDDRTGVIDMIMHPADPNTIIAALWDRQRDGFDSWPGREPKPEGVDGYDPIRKWGPGGGLYKTTDGGKTWKRLTHGLPTGMTGRIGIDWQSKSPHVIYAIIDCENIGKGPPPSTAFLGLVGTDLDGQAKITQVMPKSPAEKAGVKVGDILTAAGEKELQAFDELLDIVRERKVRDKITLKLKRGEEQLSVEAELSVRPGQREPQSAGVWLGVTGEDREGKVVLTRITDPGPAQKAGLKEGDIVSSVDGQQVTGYQALIAEVRKHKAGDKLKLKVVRGAESLDIELTVEDRPAAAAPPGTTTSSVYMGIQGSDSEKGGPVLSDITEGGPAEKAGLKPGDVVLAFDDTKLANYEALVAQIRTYKAGDKVKVTILRGEQRQVIELTFEDRPGGPSRTRPYTWSYFGQAPNVQDQQGSKGHEYGGVYRSTDAGESWERVNSLNTRPMYFSVIRVDPSDAQRVYVLGVAQFRSDDGGITFTGDFGRGVHADGHDLWIDPRDGRHMVTGGDGGFYATFDRGENWDHINTSAIGQFYHVAISTRQPYWVFGGLQDNGSWGGPAVSKNGGVLNEDWLSVGSGDGFVCRVDPEDPDLVYYESQNGAIGRRHLKTGERTPIRPRRTEGLTYRFNWNTPFILSSHNSRVFYSAGNYVFRSLDRGNNLIPISPEITLTQRGSGTAVAESPRDPNLLYAGTDDGGLWVTRDGGHEWKNITANLGIPSPRYVATIEPSRFATDRVYVCLDGHRSDDDQPYLFVSDDAGETFRSLRANLPWGSTRCLREDLHNQNLLFAGTEFAAWVSLDRGAYWLSLNTNLPTVAVHEIAVHPTNGEIVAATHGRSLWACDISGLRQLKPEHVADRTALLTPEPVIRWRGEPSRGRTNRRYTGTNPASGSQLWYALPKKSQQVTLRVEDIEGRVVRELRGATEPGLHRVSWDLMQAPPRTSAGSPGTASTARFRTKSRPTGRPAAAAKSAERPATEPNEEPKPATPDPAADKGEEPMETEEPSAPTETGRSTVQQQPGTGRGAGSRSGASSGSGPVSNGTYRVTLIVDGKAISSQTLAIVRDPTAPADAIAEEVLEQLFLDDEAAADEKINAKREGHRVWTDD